MTKRRKIPMLLLRCSIYFIIVQRNCEIIFTLKISRVEILYLERRIIRMRCTTFIMCGSEQYKFFNSICILKVNPSYYPWVGNMSRIQHILEGNASIYFVIENLLKLQIPFTISILHEFHLCKINYLLTTYVQF